MRTGQLELTLGLDRATERAELWVCDARAFVLRCDPGTRLSADDLRDAVGDPPGTGNACGAVFRRLAETGWLQQVGWEVSRRPERHRAVNRVWERT
jgi:hypothetical protein